MNILLHSHNVNQALIDLCLRQLAMKRYHFKSWFTHINKIQSQYDLSSLNRLYNKEETPTKTEFKMMYQTAINTSWSKKLLEDCRSKQSLKYVNLEACASGKPHPAQQSVHNNA